MIIIYDILWYIQKLSTKKIEIPSTALNRWLVSAFWGKVLEL